MYESRFRREILTFTSKISSRKNSERQTGSTLLQALFVLRYPFSVHFPTFKLLEPPLKAHRTSMFFLAPQHASTSGTTTRASFLNSRLGFASDRTPWLGSPSATWPRSGASHQLPLPQKPKTQRRHCPRETTLTRKRRWTSSTPRKWRQGKPSLVLSRSTPYTQLVPRPRERRRLVRHRQWHLLRVLICRCLPPTH